MFRFWCVLSSGCFTVFIAVLWIVFVSVVNAQVIYNVDIVYGHFLLITCFEAKKIWSSCNHNATC